MRPFGNYKGLAAGVIGRWPGPGGRDGVLEAIRSTISCDVHFLPFGMRYTYGGVLQIHKELEESAGVCGASPGKILLKVVMPLLWPAIMAGWVFIFLNAARDLSTAIILAGVVVILTGRK